jgi:hypothetical protein
MNEPKFRDLWILKESNSNRALIRDESEKWETDIKGEPNSNWIRVIEYSTYEHAIKCKELLLKDNEQTKLKLEAKVNLAIDTLERIKSGGYASYVDDLVYQTLAKLKEEIK